MIRIWAILSAAILVGACGGAASPSGGGGAQAPAVTVRGQAFVPQALEVAGGTTVRWTNQDNVAHTTTTGKPGTPDGKWDARLDGPGGTFEFTFAQAGTYTYFCSIHTSMTGTVTVK